LLPEALDLVDKEDETMTSEMHYIGIDVSKARLDVHVLPTTIKFSVSNDKAGIATLCERLPANIGRIVLEPSGGYEQFAVHALQTQQLPVCLVNPRQIRDFAKAKGILAKTDTLDAMVLGVNHKFCVWKASGYRMWN
jgi:transposase